jgi:histidinol dehydrogenase
MRTVSDEHGERFHHDISKIGKKYSGKWGPDILADSCSGLTRATPTGEYKRQKKK